MNCLRYVPPVQDYEPCFPDVSGQSGVVGVIPGLVVLCEIMVEGVYG